MKYEKPALSFDQQVARLLQRGMTGDREQMKARLAAVSYYRLSGYCYPFRNADDTFRPGTAFATVWERYAFDRRLRLLIMDALERIEIAVRSQLAYHHAARHGAFGYASDPASLPKLEVKGRDGFLARIREEIERSHEPFVKHFRNKYGDQHDILPIWMATEVMSFGTVLSFYRGASHQVKQAVATVFGMPDAVFESWLLTLNSVRNICAHHGRLWNRELGVKPIIPRSDKYREWHTPVKVENRRVFGVLTICQHCLRHAAPQSRWAQRLRALLDEHPAIPQREMGFPVNWPACPIWQDPAPGAGLAPQPAAGPTPRPPA